MITGYFISSGQGWVVVGKGHSALKWEQLTCVLPIMCSASLEFFSGIAVEPKYKNKRKWECLDCTVTSFTRLCATSATLGIIVNSEETGLQGYGFALYQITIKTSSLNRTCYLMLDYPVGFINPSINSGGRLMLNLSYPSEYLNTNSWSLFILLSAVPAARGHFMFRVHLSGN